MINENFLISIYRNSKLKSEDWWWSINLIGTSLTHTPPIKSLIHFCFTSRHRRSWEKSFNRNAIAVLRKILQHLAHCMKIDLLIFRPARDDSIRNSTMIDFTRRCYCFYFFLLIKRECEDEENCKRKKLFCVLFEAAPKSISCLAVISGIRNKPRKTNRLQKLY